MAVSNDSSLNIALSVVPEWPCAEVIGSRFVVFFALSTSDYRATEIAEISYTRAKYLTCLSCCTKGFVLWIVRVSSLPPRRPRNPDSKISSASASSCHRPALAKPNPHPERLEDANRASTRRLRASPLLLAALSLLRSTRVAFPRGPSGSTRSRRNAAKEEAAATDKMETNMCTWCEKTATSRCSAW